MNLSESVDERPPQHELSIPMSQIHNHPPCLSLVSVGFVVLWLRGGVLAGGPLLGVCLTACFLAGGVGVCFFGGRFLWCPYGVSCVSFFSCFLSFSCIPCTTGAGFFVCPSPVPFVLSG